VGKFVFLGSGGSVGIPVVGCDCAICHSTSPFNQRLRPAGLLLIDGKKILIDIGPDFRQQALRAKIDTVDGVVLTHTHYDHIAGIDELRIFYVRENRHVPCLLSKESQLELLKRYEYLFQPHAPGKTLPAQIDLRVLPNDAGTVEFLGIPVSYMSFYQAGMKVTGFRIGDFAYVSDIKDYDETVFEALKGVRVLILSALRAGKSPLHLSIEEAVAFARKAGAKMTRLTHLNHEIDHEIVNRSLPPDVQLGYDGLELEFNL